MKLSRMAVGLCLTAAVLLVSCNLPAGWNGGGVTPNEPAVYGTVAAMLTQTALASTPTATTDEESPTPGTASVEPSPSTTPLVSATTAAPRATATAVCDLARAGAPIDVTIPDDTRVQPGESFAKVWRLVNAGACTWTQDYAVVWFSGDDLAVRQVEPFTGPVPPGSSVDIAVDMVAPAEPGVYQSNWKLRNRNGVLFGIGPDGGAPFWVRIQVAALDTPTPTVIPPTLIPTPVVLVSGEATLQAGQSLDADAGAVTTGSDVDFTFESVSGLFTLSPVNGAGATLFGAGQPTLADCQAASVASEPILLGSELVGASLCIQTSHGRLGSLRIITFDETAGNLNLAYIVWLVP